MKITDVSTVSITQSEPSSKSEPRRPPWIDDARVATPLTKYPAYADAPESWRAPFDRFACVVTVEDGTKGFAIAHHGEPVATLVEAHLGPRLVGENAMAVERLHDTMIGLSRPFGAVGLASYAISAIDLALWDVRGKHFDVPVYELLGGPTREELPCYATGNDVDWYVELGFSDVKLACPAGPSDGADGIRETVDLVSETRTLVGEAGTVMLDCWMAFDEDYTVRLATELREHDLGWIEEPLPPDHLDAYAGLRTRLPHQTLATGEHWYSLATFQRAASRRLVDVFQPDVRWSGGLTALRKIAAIAEAAGLALVPHAGGNSPYGQHACFGLPGVTQAEYFVGSPPGVPLEEANSTAGLSTPVDGVVTPPEGPGFGVPPDLIEFDRPFLE